MDLISRAYRQADACPDAAEVIYELCNTLRALVQVHRSVVDKRITDDMVDALVPLGPGPSDAFDLLVKHMGEIGARYDRSLS